MQTFCCCIPSRLGVLLLAPLTCAASTVCSVVALYGLINYKDELALGQRIFLGALGAAMAIVALSSVFGFFGALMKSYRAVSFYATALLSLWLSIVATGVINFIFLYKDKEDVIDRCASRNEENEALQKFNGYVDQEKWCSKTFTLGFAVMVAFWGFVALCTLWLISVVRRYCRQLAQDYCRTPQPQPVYQV